MDVSRKSRLNLKKPQAERDLIEHFAFIARDKLKPAMRFLQVASETFENLAAMPTIPSPLQIDGRTQAANIDPSPCW